MREEGVSCTKDSRALWPLILAIISLNKRIVTGGAKKSILTREVRIFSFYALEMTFNNEEPK